MWVWQYLATEFLKLLEKFMKKGDITYERQISYLSQFRTYNRGVGGWDFDVWVIVKGFVRWLGAFAVIR